MTKHREKNYVLQHLPSEEAVLFCEWKLLTSSHFPTLNFLPSDHSPYWAFYASSGSKSPLLLFLKFLLQACIPAPKCFPLHHPLTQSIISLLNAGQAKSFSSNMIQVESVLVWGPADLGVASVILDNSLDFSVLPLCLIYKIQEESKWVSEDASIMKF